LTNGPITFANANATTNTSGYRVTVYLTWYGSTTTPSTIYASVTETNYAGLIPLYYSSVPGAASGDVTNTLTFPMGAGAYARFTNSLGTASILTNWTVQ
jgi:hypothetical protein